VVPALLRGRVFRRYWSASAISMFGDQVSGVALPLAAVLALHAGAACLSLRGTGVRATRRRYARLASSRSRRSAVSRGSRIVMTSPGVTSVWCSMV
jgi:hypothetical protein